MKNLAVLLVCGVLFLICGCDSMVVCRVVETSGVDTIVIDANDQELKPEARLDIYNVTDNLVEVPIARISIVQTNPTYSVGTIVIREDGSYVKPLISEIKPGMLCKTTTKETIKAEKRIYKRNKKALKRQHKLSVLKGKSGAYESLGDPNTPAMNVGVINIKDE